MVSYAFTYFDAEKAQEAELWLGTQEGIQVFLNGEEVYSFNSVTTYGDSDRGSSKGIVNVLQGRNTLLVKSLNNYGDYSFALNICEVESDPYYFGNRVSGLKFYMDESGTGSIISGLPDHKMSLTESFKCYPNPASEQATIRFGLQKSQQTAVRIYDLSGRVVKSFGREYRNAGTHELIWDLDSNLGSRVSGGTYLVTLQAGKKSRSIKLVVE